MLNVYEAQNKINTSFVRLVTKKKYFMAPCNVVREPAISFAQKKMWNKEKPKE
jgi:hypothetical protein